MILRNLAVSAVLILLCALAPAWAAREEPGTSKAARAAVGEAGGAALRGDAGRALAILGGVPAAEFAGVDADFRACMHGRFERATPVYLTASVGDAFVREVLRAYQRYWWHSLQRPDSREAQQAMLLSALKTLIGREAADARDFDALEALLQRRLRVGGYHALNGLTPPLQELMLWRRQDTRHYDVELPERRHRTRVEVLDDFVSLGWLHYASCGRHATGGWAKPEALYVVLPRYVGGLDGEEFRVVFLGHETQHYADYTRFPALKPWELEFRAKLVELAQAGETLQRKRLRGFVESQGDDESSPHAYANREVVRALRRRLGEGARIAADIDLLALPVATLQQAAKAILLEDSRRREQAIL